jgi:hypothetical protein
MYLHSASISKVTEHHAAVSPVNYDEARGTQTLARRPASYANEPGPTRGARTYATRKQIDEASALRPQE